MVLLEELDRPLLVAHVVRRRRPRALSPATVPRSPCHCCARLDEGPRPPAFMSITACPWSRPPRAARVWIVVPAEADRLRVDVSGENERRPRPTRVHDADHVGPVRQNVLEVDTVKPISSIREARARASSPSSPTTLGIRTISCVSRTALAPSTAPSTVEIGSEADARDMIRYQIRTHRVYERISSTPVKDEIRCITEASVREFSLHSWNAASTSGSATRSSPATLTTGAQLVEARIATDLGVSKTPVREALIRLQRDGLVEIEPYRGARVIEPAETDIREILELRLLLECHIARDLARRRPPDVLTASSGRSSECRQALQTGDETKVISALTEFSDVLAEACGNSRLEKALVDLRSVLLVIGNTRCAALGAKSDRSPSTSRSWRRSGPAMPKRPPRRPRLTSARSRRTRSEATAACYCRRRYSQPASLGGLARNSDAVAVGPDPSAHGCGQSKSQM